MILLHVNILEWLVMISLITSFASIYGISSFSTCPFSNFLITFKSIQIIILSLNFPVFTTKVPFSGKGKKKHLLVLFFFSTEVQVWCYSIFSKAAQLWSTITPVEDNEKPYKLWSWVLKFPRWLGMQKSFWQGRGKSRWTSESNDNW